MKASDLLPFCSTDETRVPLMKPFSRGEFTYATCGRIIIRVPRLSDVGEEGGVDEDTLTRALTVDGRPPLKIDDLTEWKPLPDFPREQFNAVCESCYEYGRVIAECPECKGTAIVIDYQFEHDAIKIGNRLLSPFLLTKLSTLPGLELSPQVGAGNEALYFRFDGGAGLLMPLAPERASKNARIFSTETP